MNTTSVAVRHEEASTGTSRVKFRRRRPHWIILDTAWAKQLGVRKTAGVYQIRSNELQLRLLLMEKIPGFSAPTPTGTPVHEAIITIHNLEVLTASSKVNAR
jgi:hypothetical protein